VACCIYRSIIGDQETVLKHNITDQMLITKVIVAGAYFQRQHWKLNTKS